MPFNVIVSRMLLGTLFLAHLNGFSRSSFKYRERLSHHSCTLGGTRSSGAEALLAKLREDVSRYVGDAEPHDDLTIVVVQVE